MSSSNKTLLYNKYTVIKVPTVLELGRCTVDIGKKWIFMSLVMLRITYESYILLNVGKFTDTT